MLSVECVSRFTLCFLKLLTGRPLPTRVPAPPALDTRSPPPCPPPPPQFYTAFNPDAEYQRIQRARQRLAQIRANVENTAAQLEAQEAAGAGWAGS